MRAKLAPELQMTVDEFLAFAESRPDEERWELIEGSPVKNASPVNVHQQFVGNLYRALWTLKERDNSNWWPLLGIGTRVPASPNSLPQPDLLVLEAGLLDPPSPVTDDAVVLFEVLSKSNTKADQAWRKRVYASIPNCQHFVTVSQAEVAVTRFDRAAKWQGVDLASGSVLDLPGLGAGVAIPLTDIYRWTPLAHRL